LHNGIVILLLLGSFGIRSIIKNIGSMIGGRLMCLWSLVYFGVSL
jgi:hypothetical protein